ncbi:DUF6766 family protein [Microvirga zambiensis]|uniref:DUF6766 family protein n=1 Tax=Microvirga zambiensis TaxID=1402137 RepID=UPI00191E3BA9|nr:DUF6766 family protein [Microvirga zambiensis]
MTIPGFRPVIFNKGEVSRCQPLKFMGEMLVEPEFWYESFQIWQREFLFIAVLLVRSTFLRESASPEAKPVGVPQKVRSRLAVCLVFGSGPGRPAIAFSS